MCIRNNYPFGLVLFDELMVFVRYGSRFELYQVSEIHRIMQYLIDNRSAPQLAAVQRILLALSLIVIFGRAEDSFFIQTVSDLSLAKSLQPQLKNVLHHRCGFGIDDRQMIRIIAHIVTVGNTTAEILASLCTRFKYCLNLLACGTAVPLIEQIDDRHHVESRTAAVSGIHMIVQSDEADIVHRKNVVDVATHFDVITTKAAEVFHHHDIDLAELCICKQSLNAWSVEVRTTIAIVHILRNKIPTFVMHEFGQDHFLIFN